MTCSKFILTPDISDSKYDTIHTDEEPEGFQEISKYWGDYKYAERKSSPYTYSYDSAMENLLIYDLSIDAFEEFVKNPYEDTLKKFFDMPLDRASVFEASLYKKNDKNCEEIGNYECVEPVLVNDNNYLVYNVNKYTEWEHTSILKSLVHSLSIGSTQKYLNENGINDKVIDRVLIHTSYYPFVLWVKTENSIYLISVELDSGLYSYKIVKKIYTIKELQSEFVESVGELIIDGEKMPDGNVIFCKDYPIIKARVIWEYLSGRDVIWHPEDRSVSFWYNGEKIDLKKKIINGVEDTIYHYYKNDEYIFHSFKPALVKGSFYWSYWHLDTYLRAAYKKELTVDTENRRVIIENIK